MTWLRPPKFSFSGFDIWASLMSRQNADVLVAVPSLLDMVLRMGAGKLHEPLSKLKLIVSSAERLNPEGWQMLQAKFAPVANIDGMSETVHGGLFALP